MVKQLSIKRPKYEKPNIRVQDDDAVNSANHETGILASSSSTHSALSQQAPTPANISELERELYFLFSRFVQESGHFCDQTAQAFIAEAAGKQLFPVRSTWTGELRSMNYEDACGAYSHLPPDYLVQILRRSVNVINDVFPLDGGCSTSLLTDGRRSLLRDEQNCLNISSKRRLRLVAPAYDAKPRAALVKEPLNFLLTELQRESRTASLSLQSRYSARKFAGDFRLLKTIYSHLAPVFCTLYDATGRYFFTASDDRLIKVHETRSGRLLTTLRGHPKEIGDMSIDNENRLLVSGCTGNTIRIWQLLDGKPIAAFRTHTHTVSAVKFLPLTFDKRRRFFASSGLDGNLVLFEYDRIDLNFDAVEPRYLVDYRGRNSGTTQFGVVCFAFSKGGLFLACGSNDHYLRIFRLLTLKKSGSRSQHGKLDLCVEEDYSRKAHTDRVDSIVFANKSTRFVSGSRDGKGLIWRRDGEGWHSIEINCSTAWCDPSSDPQADRKARIGMVAWSCDDRLIFTSSSKNSVHCVKVWNSSNGAILHDLFGHYSDIFVLAAHPWQPHILLTSSHDGQAVIWNPATGEKLWSWQNIIPNCGQEDIALLDAAFNPEGDQALITDYYGNVHMFGITSGSAYRSVPDQQFFHTDYHPINAVGARVVDRNTHLDAYRMQPPLLVHADGDPYDWHLQRLVPGRETITYEQTRSIRTQIQQQYIHNALAMQLGDAADGAAAAVPAVQPPGANVANDAQVAAVAIMGFAEAMAPAHEPITAALGPSASNISASSSTIRLNLPAAVVGGPSTSGAAGTDASRSADAAAQPLPSQQFDVTKPYEGERRIVEPFDATTESRILDEKQVVTHRELEQYLLLKDRLHRHKRLAKLAALGNAGVAAAPAVSCAKKEDEPRTADGRTHDLQRDARRNGQVMRLRSHQQQQRRNLQDNGGGGLRDGRNRVRPPRDHTVPDGTVSLQLLRQLMRRRTHPNATAVDADRLPTTEGQTVSATSRGSTTRRRGGDSAVRREDGGSSAQLPPSRQQQIAADENDSDADPDWEVRSEDYEVEESARLRRRRQNSGSSIEYTGTSRSTRPLRPAHPDRSFDTSSSEDEVVVVSETDEEDLQAVSGSDNEGLYRDDEGFTIEEHQLERFGSRRRRKRALDEARARRINNQNMPTTSQNAADADFGTAAGSSRPIQNSRGRRRNQSSSEEDEMDSDGEDESDEENRRRSTRLRERLQRGQRLRWFEDDEYSGGEEFQARSRNTQRNAVGAASSTARTRRRVRIADDEADEIRAMDIDGISQEEAGGEDRLRTSPTRRSRRAAEADMPSSRSRAQPLTVQERRTAASLRKLADSETSRDASPAEQQEQQQNEDDSKVSRHHVNPSSSASLRNWLALPTTVGRNAEQDYYDAAHPNAWIRQHTARKSPYFPQINDLVCYYKKAHAKFVEFVQKNNVIELSERQRDIANRLADVDFLRVIDISFVFMDSSWAQLEPPTRSARDNGVRQLVVAKIKLCRESAEAISAAENAAPGTAERDSNATLQDNTASSFERALFGTDEASPSSFSIDDRIRNDVASKLAADAVLGAFADLRQEMQHCSNADAASRLPTSAALLDGSVAEDDSDSASDDDVTQNSFDLSQNGSAAAAAEVINQKRPAKRKAHGARRAAAGRKRVKRKGNNDAETKAATSTPPQPTDPHSSSSRNGIVSARSSSSVAGAVGEEFEIMYADLLNVDPFLVLLSDVRETCHIKWKPKELCSAVLDGRRWYGHVVAVKPYDGWQNSAGAYRAVSVQWKQPANPAEIIELFSPWDLMPVPPGTSLATVKDGALLPRSDLIDLGERYDAAPEICQQWPAGDRVKTLWLINQYINHVQDNDLFGPFVRPVNLREYPGYLAEIPYPTDLWKICTRANYLFYRTFDAVQYDVTCIARNCGKFNAPGASICKRANVLTGVLTCMLAAVRELKQFPEVPDFEWIDRVFEEVVEQAGGMDWVDTDDPVAEAPADSSSAMRRGFARGRRVPPARSERRTQLEQPEAAADEIDDDIVDADREESAYRYPKRQTRGKLPTKFQNDVIDCDAVGVVMDNSGATRRKSNRITEQQQPHQSSSSFTRRGANRVSNLFDHGLPLQRGDFRPDAARSSRTRNADRTPQKQRPNVRYLSTQQEAAPSSAQNTYADDLQYDGLARRSVRIVARSLAAVEAEQQQFPNNANAYAGASRTRNPRRPAANRYAEYDEMAGISSSNNAAEPSNGRRRSFRGSPRRGSNNVNYAESGTSDDYSALANLSGTDIDDEASEETFSRSTTSNDAINNHKAQIKMRLTRRQAKHNTRGASSAYVIAELKEEDEEGSYEEDNGESSSAMQQVDEDYATTEAPVLVAEQNDQLSSSNTNSTLMGDDGLPPVLPVQCIVEHKKLEPQESGVGPSMHTSSSSAVVDARMANIDAAICQNMPEMFSGTFTAQQTSGIFPEVETPSHELRATFGNETSPGTSQLYVNAASGNHTGMVNGVHTKAIRSGNGRRKVKIEDDDENSVKNDAVAASSNPSTPVAGLSVRKSSRAPVRKERSDFIYNSSKKQRVKDEDFEIDEEDAGDGLETDYDDDKTDDENDQPESDDDVTPANSSRGGSSYGKRKKKPQRKSIAKKRSASKSKKSKSNGRKRLPAATKKKSSSRAGGSKRKSVVVDADDDDDDDDADEDYDADVAASSSHTKRRSTRAVARNTRYNIDKDFGSGDED